MIMATVTGVTQRTADVSNQNQIERYTFLFMRLTGSGLLFLAVGHMLIQHVLNSSGNLTIQFVAAQWNSWGWKTYDLLLLIFAVSHGFNGLRTVLEDYIHNERTMTWIRRFLFVFTIITIIWAAIAISAFDPSKFN
jgi:succinate dehydrogenase / fumarate reductase, membrane anchor subunit